MEFRTSRKSKYHQARRVRKTNRSELEENLVFQLSAMEIEFVREYKFAAEHVGPGSGVKSRLAAAGLQNWRFDFAWPDIKFAVEVEGGAWVGGGHNTGKGFTQDLKKYHQASRLGWFLYRCDKDLIDSGLAAMFIEKHLIQQRAKRDRISGLFPAWKDRLDRYKASNAKGEAAALEFCLQDLLRVFPEFEQ